MEKKPRKWSEDVPNDEPENEEFVDKPNAEDYDIEFEIEADKDNEYDMDFEDTLIPEVTVGAEDIFLDEDEIVEILTKPTIKQLGLDNQLIRTYVSIKEASDHTGIDPLHILDACDGFENHTFGNFKWMYID
jgi:hypothetical protein